MNEDEGSKCPPLMLLSKTGVPEKYNFIVNDEPYKILQGDQYDPMVVDSLDVNGQIVYKSETINSIKIKNGLFGIFNPNHGTWLIEPIMNDIQIPVYASPKYYDSYSFIKERDYKGHYSPSNKVEFSSKKILHTNDLIFYKLKTKWGMISVDGKELLKPNWDSISIFKEMLGKDTLLNLYKNGIQSLANKKANVFFSDSVFQLLPFTNYFDVFNPDTNLKLTPTHIIVKGGNKKYYKVVSEPRPVYTLDEYGFLLEKFDENGQNVYTHDTITQFYYSNSKFGLLDIRNKKILQNAIYSEIFIPINDFQSNGDNPSVEMKYLISTNKPTNHVIDQYSIPMQRNFILKGNNKFSIYDWKMDSTYSITSDSIQFFNDSELNCVLYYLKGKIGLFNLNTYKTVQPQFDYTIASGGYAITNNSGILKMDHVMVKESQPIISEISPGEYGPLLDANGNAITKDTINEKTLKWIKGGKFGLINLHKSESIINPESGKLIISCKTENSAIEFLNIADSISYLNGIPQIISLSAWHISNGKSIMYSLANDSILDTLHAQEVIYMPKTISFKVRRNNKWAIIRANGTLVCDFKYDSITEGDGLFYNIKLGNEMNYMIPDGYTFKNSDDVQIGPLIMDMYSVEYKESQKFVLFKLSTGEQLNDDHSGMMYMELRQFHK